MFDIVIIGNYTKDTIVSPSGSRQVDGGGFNYAAHVARMMGLNTAAVTRLSYQDRHVVQSLVDLGVTVFPAYTATSTVLTLCYPTADPDQRTISVASTAGAFTPDQVRNLDARAFLVNGSMRGEIGLDVLSVLKAKPAILAADVQAFIRVLTPGGFLAFAPWPEKEQFLGLVDILKTDAVEAEGLTGLQDIHEAARTIAGWGPKEVVLTHRDGVLAFAEGRFHEAPFQPRKLVGRSGRGDTCGGAYTAKRMTASPEESLVWAAAVTSLKLESEGPILRTVSEVEALIESSYSTR